MEGIKGICQQRSHYEGKTSHRWGIVTAIYDIYPVYQYNQYNIRDKMRVPLPPPPRDQASGVRKL